MAWVFSWSSTDLLRVCCEGVPSVSDAPDRSAVHVFLAYHRKRVDDVTGSMCWGRRLYLRQVVVARSSICTGMLVCAVLKFIHTVAACPQTMFIFSAGLHLIERIFRTECQQLGCRENSSSHFKERLCLPMSCDVCIINACWQKSWTEFSRLLASTDIKISQATCFDRHSGYNTACT